MSTPTYPGARNNDPNSNEEVFRDISVINQPSGGIEFRNTKDDEIVTVYHKNGSFYRIHKTSTDMLHTNDKREHVMGDSFTEVNGNVVQVFDKDVETVKLGNQINKVGDVDKWQKYMDKIKNAIRPLHDLKRLFELKRTKKYNDIDQAPDQEISGALAPTPSDEIETQTLVIKTPTKYISGIKIPCAHQIPQVEDCEYEYKDIVASDGWGEFTGWGTGESPSTQDGTWTEESAKQLITNKKIEINNEIMEYEKQLGQNKHRDGGNNIDYISKDYVGMIGLSFNDLESFRIDPRGKLVPYGMKIDPFGNSIYMQYRESPLLEQVHVEKLPGGSYTLVVSQEYNLTVGSGGINIKTTGPMELFSPSINVAAEEINVSSRGEIELGAKRFDVSAEIITFRPKKTIRQIEDASGNPRTLPANNKDETEPEQAILFDGNLNVSKNMVVAGGAHIEGEVTLQHITAPMEEQITDGCFEWGTQMQCSIDTTNDGDCQEPQKSAVHADILAGCLIGYCIVGSGSSAGTWPVYSTCAPNAVQVHDHFHYFKNLPLKLIRDNVDVEVTVGDKTDLKNIDPHSVVRAMGARNNFATKINSLPIKNSTTNNTVLEKFGGSVCDQMVIDNGNYGEQKNKDDTIPETEGVRSAKYSDEDLEKIKKELEDKFEKRYQEIIKMLSNSSST